MSSLKVVHVAWPLLFAALLTGCGGGGGGSGSPPVSASFAITDASGAPVAGATLYLVPASDVDGSPITANDVLTGAAADRDEPLEDQVRLDGAGYPQGVTAADGGVVVPVIPAGDYFWFVAPAATDTEHLPGGSGCRHSRNTSSFVGLTTAITLTSQPTGGATYVGSSACIACHQTYAASAQHAHRLGLTRPGVFGSLQDPARYPQIQAGWNLFLSAAAFGGGTMVTCTDFDPARDTDKFKTFLSNPSGTVFLRAWLWRDTSDGDKFKITLQNIINPADPSSPRTYEVGLTYGGAVYKQRYLVKVPGRHGLYPLLQWQPDGSESRFDRTRRVIRDYRLDSFWNAASMLLQDPVVGTQFDANCMACHATGFTRFQDTMTGEWLTDAVDDPTGEYDIDQDSTPDEINVGCESCHGPGSAHAAWAGSPANVGHERRFIVNPLKLSPSREAMVCGRCHDRVVGNWSVSANEEPLNAAGQMAPVGISRQEWLASYTSVKGPGPAALWADDLHSRAHHQQYSDFIKSTMHRNDRILTTCGDCHDDHGFGPFARHTVSDPNDANGMLCLRCHATDLLTHMTAQTNSTHAGPSTQCVRCHMPRTAQGGAGKYGLLLGVPNGTMTDESLTYFENDLSSHLFKVPRKTHPSVAGMTPAFAMPIPYTTSCGAVCHSPATIPLTTLVPPMEPSRIPDCPASPGPSKTQSSVSSKE